MSKRLLLSTILLLGCVIGILNFSFFAEAAKNNNNDNKKERKQEKREERKDERKEEKKEERKDDKKCGLKHDEKLKASLDLNNGSVTFRNNEDHCSFKVGLASYKVYIPKNSKNNDWLNTQTLYDFKSATIGPNQSVTLQVNTPSCSYQLDAYRGDVVEEFNVRKNKKGGGYDGRIIEAGINSNLPVCGGVIAPTPTRKPTVTPYPTKKHSKKPTLTPKPTHYHKPTATPKPTYYHKPTHTPVPTHKPTATPTHVPPAVPTPVIQIINDNNNVNNNTNEQHVIVEQGDTIIEEGDTIIEEGDTIQETIVQPEVIREVVYRDSGNGGYVVEEVVEDDGEDDVVVEEVIEVTPTAVPDEEEVIEVTDKGKKVYVAPKTVEETPSTGPESLSLLALLPSGIAGMLLRRKFS